MDINCIPLDYNNLPCEEKVLVLAGDNLIVAYIEEEGLIDDECRVITKAEAYIPLDNLRQLWATQNPAASYSKDSEAYNILERALLDNPSFDRIFEEISSEATSTIDFFAWEMLSQFNGSGVLHKELVHWIKDYIKSFY